MQPLKYARNLHCLAHATHHFEHVRGRWFYLGAVVIVDGDDEVLNFLLSGINVVEGNLLRGHSRLCITDRGYKMTSLLALFAGITQPFTFPNQCVSTYTTVIKQRVHEERYMCTKLPPRGEIRKFEIHLFF